jgi:hypothetical protein
MPGPLSLGRYPFDCGYSLNADLQTQEEGRKAGLSDPGLRRGFPVSFSFWLLERIYEIATLEQQAIGRYLFFEKSPYTLKTYSDPVGGAYPAPKVLRETDLVELIIEGHVSGVIPVADLLTRP